MRLNLIIYCLSFLTLISCGGDHSEAKLNTLKTVSELTGTPREAMSILIFEHSDSCDLSGPVISITENTDCGSLTDRTAWSTSINGKCTNIQDVSASEACWQTKLSTSTLIFEHSDSCDLSGPVISITENTDCGSLTDRTAWSTSINGKCTNIQDVSASEACWQTKLSTSTLIFEHSDSCDFSGPVISITENIDCGSLTDRTAWSTSINGQCTNIRDVSASEACWQTKLSTSTLIFEHSDSCDLSGPVISITENIDCGSLTDRTAWSTSINGKCTNIRDVSASEACWQTKLSTSTLIFEHSDSCDLSGPVISITKNTDCGSLTDRTAWSTSINGKCTNIRDVSASEACWQTKLSTSTLIFEHSDSCDLSGPVISITENTDCGSLTDRTAWSTSINGKCTNIRDVSASEACWQTK